MEFAQPNFRARLIGINRQCDAAIIFAIPQYRVKTVDDVTRQPNITRIAKYTIFVDVNADRICCVINRCRKFEIAGILNTGSQARRNAIILSSAVDKPKSGNRWRAGWRRTCNCRIIYIILKLSRDCVPGNVGRKTRSWWVHAFVIGRNTVGVARESIKIELPHVVGVRISPRR